MLEAEEEEATHLCMPRAVAEEVEDVYLKLYFQSRLDNPYPSPLEQEGRVATMRLEAMEAIRLLVL